MDYHYLQSVAFDHAQNQSTCCFHSNEEVRHCPSLNYSLWLLPWVQSQRTNHSWSLSTSTKLEALYLSELDVDPSKMEDKSKNWMETVNRGGLKHVSNMTYMMFASVELELHKYNNDVKPISSIWWTTPHRGKRGGHHKWWCTILSGNDLIKLVGGCSHSLAWYDDCIYMAEAVQTR